MAGRSASGSASGSAYLYEIENKLKLLTPETSLFIRKEIFKVPSMIDDQCPMGNEESSFEGIEGVWLQSQDSEHLWGVVLQGEEEDGTCVFTRQPGSVAQGDLCRAGVEVGS